MFTFVLMVICLIGFVVVTGVKNRIEAENKKIMANKSPNKYSEDRPVDTTGINLARLITLGCTVLFFFMSTLFIVKPGEVGVGILFGKTSQKTFKSGLNFKNPMLSIAKMPIRLQEYTMSRTTSEGKKEGAI